MPGILIVAEHMDGALRDITGEMIGAATALKASLGGPLLVAVIGDADGSLAEAANIEGVDEVLSIAAPSSHFDASVYEEAVCTLAEERTPGAIFIAHSAAGMAFGAAVAARLSSGFASDVFDIQFEAGEINVTRGSYGGKVNIELGFPGKSCVTLMPRGATFPAPDGRRNDRQITRLDDVVRLVLAAGGDRGAVRVQGPVGCVDHVPRPGAPALLLPAHVHLQDEIRPVEPAASVPQVQVHAIGARSAHGSFQDFQVALGVNGLDKG